MDKILWAEGEARSYHIVLIFKYVQKNRRIEKQIYRKTEGTYRRVQYNMGTRRHWSEILERVTT